VAGASGGVVVTWVDPRGAATEKLVVTDVIETIGGEVVPYDIDGFADALARAVDMLPDERRARMRSMRRVVAGRNVFSWASDILEGLESLWTKPLQYAARAPEDAPV
jgi:glycosyltransferase involved in cell wall biosynthesis